MTFKEYCKTHTLGWYRPEELPEDVREDLYRLLENNNRHIGFVIYHSHVRKEDHIVFEGMKIGYYWRTIKPMLSLEPWHWFWRIKKIDH